MYDNKGKRQQEAASGAAIGAAGMVNPYVGAGLALIQASQKQKAQRENLMAQAENERRNKILMALKNLQGINLAI